MNSLKKQIQIKASLEKIWAILADVTRTPEWVDGVKESERTGAVREGQGIRERRLARCLGRYKTSCAEVGKIREHPLRQPSVDAETLGPRIAF